MPRPRNRTREVRSRAYTITTTDAMVVLTVAETPDRLAIRLTLAQGQLSMSATLDKAQWDALMGLRYDVDIEEEPEPPARLEPEPLAQRTTSVELDGVPPGERAIELRTAAPLAPGQTVNLEGCPNALLPDGPVCPRCGGRRAPSGIDGGSWVHFAVDDSERENPQPNAPNTEDDDVPF